MVHTSGDRHGPISVPLGDRRRNCRGLIALYRETFEWSSLQFSQRMEFAMCNGKRDGEQTEQQNTPFSASVWK
jgi:hypothetical protein